MSVHHTCVTGDGVPISVGLRVRDYDGKVGTVTGEPQSFETADGVELYPCDGKGWSAHPHPDGRPGLASGCWWDVTPDGETRPGSFDGSRITTRLTR